MDFATREVHAEYRADSKVMEVDFLSESWITLISVNLWNDFHPIFTSDSLFVRVITAKVEGEFEILRVRSIENLHTHPHGVWLVVPNICINGVICGVVVVHKHIVANSSWVDFPDYFTQGDRFIVQSEFNVLFGVLNRLFLSQDLELKLF